MLICNTYNFSIGHRLTAASHVICGTRLTPLRKSYLQDQDTPCGHSFLLRGHNHYHDFDHYHVDPFNIYHIYLDHTIFRLSLADTVALQKIHDL